MSESPNNVVHIKCRIEGEPAKILRELCDRGLARSYTDAINQGLLALYERVVTRDLQIAQLKRLVEGDPFEPPEANEKGLEDCVWRSLRPLETRGEAPPPILLNLLEDSLGGLGRLLCGSSKRSCRKRGRPHNPLSSSKKTAPRFLLEESSQGSS